FRHVILLMTSNVGAREMAQRTPGFGATPASSSAGAEIAAFRDEPGASPALRGDPASDQAVERLFSPEFRNRLDARLRFRPLDPSVMEQIVDKMVGELAKQLQTKKVTLEITPEARTLLAQKGYDPAFGARPLGRVIDETIRQPLTTPPPHPPAPPIAAHIHALRSTAAPRPAQPGRRTAGRGRGRYPRDTAASAPAPRSLALRPDRRGQRRGCFLGNETRLG